MVNIGQDRLEKGIKISQETQKVMNTVHVVVSDALKAAVRAVVEEDQSFVKRVISMKVDINRLIEQANIHQAERLISEDSGKFEAYSLEMEIIEKLKRIYYHTKHVAKSVLEMSEKDALVLEAA